MEQNDDELQFLDGPGDREDLEGSQGYSSSDYSEGSSKVGYAVTQPANELGNLLGGGTPKESPSASAEKSGKGPRPYNKLGPLKSKTVESASRLSDGGGLNFEKLAGMGARQLETDSEVDSFEERYMGSNLGDGSSGDEAEAGLPSLETPKNDESLAQLPVAGQ